MTADHRVELLAQGMWLGTFGVTRLLADWTDFAEQNPSTADALRARASDMIDTHTSAAKISNQNAPARTHHHSSLDWLFQS